MTLSPAYGRDYTKAADVLKDWKAGKDFIIEDFLSPWCGKPTSIRDKHEGTIMIRYKKKTLTVKVQ